MVQSEVDCLLDQLSLNAPYRSTSIFLDLNWFRIFVQIHQIFDAIRITRNSFKDHFSDALGRLIYLNTKPNLCYVFSGWKGD